MQATYKSKPIPRETDSVEVNIPNWSGPLDLLLDLIRASKLKIQEISISQITTDYLATLKQMRKINLDLSADFLSMAAHLIYLKSKTLLPDEFNEDQNDIENPKKELIQQLINYEKYKLAAERLNHLSSHKIHFVETSREKKIKKKLATTQDQWEKIDILEVFQAFHKVMETHNTAPPIISDREFKTEEKIDLIRQQLVQNQKIKFDQLFQGKEVLKQERIVTLWALLELYKTNEIEVKQHILFGDIFIFPHSSDRRVAD